MTSLFRIQIAALFTLFAVVFSSAQVTKYKCMLQMNSYVGEKAYIVASLVNEKGVYEKTLYVMGPDKKWYNTVKEWHKFQSKKPVALNAITGASVAGGDRSITTFAIENKYLNKGYKIRFESAVEDQKYHIQDAEIPLTTEGVTAKTDGKGYIKYVKLIKL